MTVHRAPQGTRRNTALRDCNAAFTKSVGRQRSSTRSRRWGRYRAPAIEVHTERRRPTRAVLRYGRYVLHACLRRLLRAQITAILDRKDMNDDDKVDEIANVLRRYVKAVETPDVGAGTPRPVQAHATIGTVPASQQQQQQQQRFLPNETFDMLYTAAQMYSPSCLYHR